MRFHQQQVQGTLPSPYSVVNGLVLHVRHYVLNPSSPLCSIVISEFDDTPSGGHAGVKLTLARLAANFYWTGMRKFLVEYGIKVITLLKQSNVIV